MNLSTTVQSALNKPFIRQEDSQYDEFENNIKQQIANHRGPLFTTDTQNLWLNYYNSLRAPNRQHYNCRCCKNFIEKYGTLVSIDENGNQIPVVWSCSAPPMFEHSRKLLYYAVKNSKVTGVFVSNELVWGTPETKFLNFTVWTHLSGTPDKSTLYKGIVLTPSQRAAELSEDFKTLKRGLSELTIENIQLAVRILKADALTRAEKALGNAEWLLELKEKVESTPKSRRDNVIWLAVATAPAGYCHARSNILSTLVDDIQAGFDYETIKNRWSKKMCPAQYMRPTKISDGAVAQAEKIFSKLESAGSLARRFARFDEVPKLWEPCLNLAQKVQKSSGVFDSLKGKNSAPRGFVLPGGKLTWEKFVQNHLHSASGIKVKLSSDFRPFIALLTAVNPDAPPLLQWDGLDGYERNPVSYYVYLGGSRAVDWNLSPGLVRVTGICHMPHQWDAQDKFAHFANGTVLLLENCKDKKYKSAGLGLFPELMRSEYHSVRQVIEAYSRKNVLEGYDTATANGYLLSKNMDKELVIQVSKPDGDYEFTIDRWE